MTAPAKRGAAAVAPLSQALELLAREESAIQKYSSPEEAWSAAKRIAAIVDLLDRAGAQNDIINKATLVRMKAAVTTVDLYDAGVERGEFAHESDNQHTVRRSGVRTTTDLGLDKRRLAEARAIRDSDCVTWFEELVESGRNTYEHALRRAKRMNRTKKAKKRRTPDPDFAVRVEITVDDVRTFRPSGVDVIITDSPYITADAIDLYAALGEMAAAVLPPGGLCVAMTSTALLVDAAIAMGQHLDYFWTVAWTFEHGRDFSPDHKHKLYDRWKPLLIFTNGPVRDDREWFHDHIPSKAAEKDLHDWQQSLDGMKTIVHRFTVPEMTVCDPFVGSGTTALAAATQGRHFIGCDIDPAAVRVARERLGL